MTMFYDQMTPEEIAELSRPITPEDMRRDCELVPGTGRGLGINIPDFGTPGEYREFAAEVAERCAYLAAEMEVTATWSEARWARWEALPSPEHRERSVAAAVRRAKRAAAR
jgi:hypothetical protein